MGSQTKAKTDEANYIQSLWEKEEVETAFLLPLKNARERTGEDDDDSGFEAIPNMVMQRTNKRYAFEPSEK